MPRQLPRSRAPMHPAWYPGWARIEWYGVSRMAAAAAYDEIADWYEGSSWPGHPAGADLLGIEHGLRDLLGPAAASAWRSAAAPGAHHGQVRALGWTPVGGRPVGRDAPARPGPPAGRAGPTRAGCRSPVARPARTMAVMAHTDMPAYPAVLRRSRPGAARLAGVGAHRPASFVSAAGSPTAATWPRS